MEFGETVVNLAARLILRWNPMQEGIDPCQIVLKALDMLDLGHIFHLSVFDGLIELILPVIRFNQFNKVLNNLVRLLQLFLLP